MVSDGETATTDHNFTDDGDFEVAIAWCNENAVMTGVSDTSFGTEEDVTREQFALILQKLAESEGKGADSDPDALDDFADAENISSWASDGMAWAVSNQLMSGSENNLNPRDPITRTEVAVMLLAFDNL